MKGILALVRKAGWAVLDQGTSAVSNVLLAVMIARQVDAADFGDFSIAFVVFNVGIAIMRAVAGQPLQINFSARSEAEFAHGTSRALGFSFVTAAAGGLVCTLCGLLIGGGLGPALLALGVCLPLMLTQDIARMAMFARERADQATAIDALWVVVQTVALLVLTLAGVQQIWALMLAWGLSGGVSLLLGLRLLRVWPSLRRPLSWFTEQKALTGYLFAEYFVGLGASHVGTLLAGATSGPRVVGALRAAQVLLGPLGIVGTAAFTFMVPQVARRAEAGERQLLRIAHLMMAGLGVVAVAYVSVLLLIPDPVGAALFGDSWAGAQQVLFAMSVNAVLAAICSAPACVLYGIGRARTTFRVNMVKAPLMLVGIPVATWFYGAPGAAWAIATCEMIVLPLWYIALRRAAPLGPVKTLQADEASAGAGRP